MIKSVREFQLLYKSHFEKSNQIHNRSYPQEGFNCKFLSLTRGQSNEEWSLSPNLYRNNLFYSEKLEIDKAIQRLDIKNEKTSLFHKLAYIQHFGYNTRLLDVTTNPYVALFFACFDNDSKNKDKNGKVFLFDHYPSYPECHFDVIINMEYIFNYGEGYLNIPHFIKNLSKGTLDQLNDKNRCDLTSSCILDPLLSNIFYNYPISIDFQLQFPRAKIQSGMFLMFQMRDRDSGRIIASNYDKEYFNFAPFDSEYDMDDGYPWPRKTWVIIAAESKSKILKDLKLLGYSKETLFPV